MGKNSTITSFLKYHSNNSQHSQKLYIWNENIKTKVFMFWGIHFFRLSAQGQTRANDLTTLFMLHSISTAFKSLLRPSEMSSHEKSPANSLSSTYSFLLWNDLNQNVNIISDVINEGQCDVDKLLMHLEAKEFTVEPTTLQSLQQLIQWVGNLAVNLLLKIPESRPSQSKG